MEKKNSSKLYNRAKKKLNPLQNLKKGDIVLLRDENISWNHWSLGRIANAMHQNTVSYEVFLLE